MLEMHLALGASRVWKLERGLGINKRRLTDRAGPTVAGGSRRTSQGGYPASLLAYTRRTETVLTDGQADMYGIRFLIPHRLSQVAASAKSHAG